MALYRCPKCGEIVPREDARRCLTCGLTFDLDHEPVLDDGSGKPESVKKKEKRAKIIVIAVIALIFAGALLWAVANGKFALAYMRRH